MTKRPEKKFVFDLVSGIVSSSKILITDIVRGISDSPESFKAAHKRLDRNLGNYSLEPLKERFSNDNIASLTNEHIVAIDMGDICKKYAKTMEGLANVCDGSEGHKVSKGYWLIGAVAVNPLSRDKIPKPIELKLYSTLEGSFKSENTITLELLRKLKARSPEGVTPHVVIDRGGDRGVILKELINVLSLDFTIRLKRRNVKDYENNEIIAIPMNENDAKEIMQNQGEITRISEQGKRKPFKIKFGWKKVFIPSVSTGQMLTLVVAKQKNKKEPMYLITSKIIETKEDAMRIIATYLSRWTVEEFYRFNKTSGGLEAVRTQRLHATKNLIAAFFIACCFQAEMSLRQDVRKASQKVVFRLKKAPTKLYNWMYRVSELLQIKLKRGKSWFKKTRDKFLQRRTLNLLRS